VTLGAGDMIDWLADRETLLIAAWTQEIAIQLSLERVLAEVLSAELYNHMLTTWLREGSYENFLKLASRSNSGRDLKTETQVAERFYDVTLKLARAADRKTRYDRTRNALPYLRTIVVDDGRHKEGHRAFGGIILLADHPFWKKWFPPLEMDCRCGVIQLTHAQFEREGYEITNDDELAWREANLSASWPTHFLPLLDFRR
jgi:hypothetical protein